MLKIYGDARSRAYRCVWLMKELGLEFEQVSIDLSTAAKEDAFLAINPNGKVPALVDGAFTLWESIAINLYLAKKFESELTPRTLEEEARALQWSLWAVSECEPHAVAVYNHKFPRAARTVSDADAAAAGVKLGKQLTVLDGVLARSPYLVGDRFTVADLNVAAIVSGAKAAGLDLSAVPHAGRWLSQCLRRPAQREAVRAMTQA
jgi:glutathione S-transferase